MRAHGDAARYRHGPDINDQPGQGCRCAPCREAARVRLAEWRAAGRTSVPADPVRAHLRNLRRWGVGVDRIAELSGVGQAVIINIVKGTRTGRPPARILPRTADALLAVTVNDQADHALVDSAAAWSRVDWLLAHGWTLQGLAWELDRTTSNLRRRRARCTARFARATAAIVAAELEARRDARRLPLDPLNDLLAARGLTASSARADAVAVDRSLWARWTTTGVQVPIADRLAHAAGVHPTELWPDFYEDVAA